MREGVDMSWQGSIEVICGPMFSGKTEELIRRVRRAQIARLKVQIFKPSIDDRYHKTQVVSHSSQAVDAQVVDNSEDIFRYLQDTTRVVAIDEIQFFDKNIIAVVNRLANQGRRVIAAGLDLDYKTIPFGPMPELLAIADEVFKIKAICTVCGNPATRSQRTISGNKATVLVGEKEAYEARCRAHYELDEANNLTSTDLSI